MSVLAFDTSVLSAFARAGALPTLQLVTSAHERVMVAAVRDELERGIVQYPRLGDVLSLTWLGAAKSVDGLRELTAFAHYSRLLGSAAANIGECATLAFAETARAVAVIDDQAAVNAARARGVTVRRTLALLCEGIRHAVLDATAAASLVDELKGQGGARLPCTGASFVHWATTQNLL